MKIKNETTGAKKLISSIDKLKGILASDIDKIAAGRADVKILNLDAKTINQLFKVIAIFEKDSTTIPAEGVGAPVKEKKRNIQDLLNTDDE